MQHLLVTLTQNQTTNVNLIIVLKEKHHRLGKMEGIVTMDQRIVGIGGFMGFVDSK